MEIKVLGSGCANCKRLEALVHEVLAEKGQQAIVTKVSDFREIAALGVFSTPGLVLDGEVKSAGRIPSKTELAGWLG